MRMAAPSSPCRRRARASGQIERRRLPSRRRLSATGSRFFPHHQAFGRVGRHRGGGGRAIVQDERRFRNHRSRRRNDEHGQGIPHSCAHREYGEKFYRQNSRGERLAFVTGTIFSLHRAHALGWTTAGVGESPADRTTVIDPSEPLEANDVMWYAGGAGAIASLRRVPGLAPYSSDQVDKLEVSVITVD